MPNVDDCPHQIREAHDRSSKHRAEILASDHCACFYCLATFPPSAVQPWTDVSTDSGLGQTALCPKCGIDSVLGSAASGVALTDHFLEEMHRYWFVS